MYMLTFKKLLAEKQQFCDVKNVMLDETQHKYTSTLKLWNRDRSTS